MCPYSSVVDPAFAAMRAALVCPVACGCGLAGDPATQLGASAFRFDQSKQVVFLDTRAAPPQQRRFDIGQGSLTLETLHVKDKKLTFRYTPEVEGGCTIYECTIPVSSTPVEFSITPQGIPGATSIDLKKCKVIFKGSVRSIPPDKRIVDFVAWLKRKGVTVECTTHGGSQGSLKIIEPTISGDYEVRFIIRSFPSYASEAEMREAIDVNLAYMLNAPAHLAMSYAGFHGKNADSTLSESDDELPKVNGMPVTKAVEKWFLEYIPKSP